MIIEERAYARAGLLGNPSDGYFGKAISISVKNFGAHVSLYESPELCIEPQEQDLNQYADIHTLIKRIKLHGYYGGDRLIKAAIKTFFDYCQKNGIKLPKRNFTVRYHSSIPRQVGLAGSSGIITAAMKALMRFYEIDIPMALLPSEILKAEVKELGMNAGLQDRVIQVYEGCVYMDFPKEMIQAHHHGKYERIDTSLLPDLYIGYKNELGKISGHVLNEIRIGYEKGDPGVLDTLNQIADLARTGRDKLIGRDLAGFNDLINRNFDLRARIMPISDSNMEMVHTARRCGASAKFAGSGGSIIGGYEDNEMLTRLIGEMKKINVRIATPFTS